MSRKQINPKKRFLILKRDNHTCQYCGLKAGQGIQLQIDHKIPVSKGGDNSIDNLVTSCFECNIGKGNTDNSEFNKLLYKTKINDSVKKHMDLVLKYWNQNRLGNIDGNTMALFSILHKESLGGNTYKQWLDYPNKFNKGDWKSVDLEEADELFKKGGEFCDEILSLIEGPFFTYIDMDLENLDDYFEDIIYDAKRKKGGMCENNFNNRLNYELTSILIGLELKNEFSIKKFSYFYNELKNV